MSHVAFTGMMDGLVVDQIVRDETFNMPTKHFHNEYEIYYLIDGTRYYFIDNQTYHIKKGSLVVINRQVIHKTSDTNNPYHNRILLEINESPISPKISAHIGHSLKEIFEKHSGIYELNDDERSYVESLLSSMIQEFKGKKVNFESMVLMKLTELIIFIQRYQKSNGELIDPYMTTSKHKKVHDVANYILGDVGTEVNLSFLAEHFYISKCYLSRIFKEITGFTVNEYINVNRVKRAQELLIHSDYNITEIAEMTGYESITYFERIFKRYTETSPLKYRKKMQLISLKARERRTEKGLNKLK